MHRGLGLAALAGVSALVTALPAAADPLKEGQFVVGPRIGTTFIIGDHLEALTTSSTQINPNNQQIPVVSWSTTAFSFRDIYKQPVTAGFDVGYMLTSSLELFGGGSYVFASGRQKTIGTATITKTTFDFDTGDTIMFNETTSLRAEFNDYHEIDGEIGARWHFMPGFAFRPFVGASARLIWRDDLHMDLRDDTSFVIGRVRLYDSGAKIGGGLQAGVNFEVVEGASLGAMIGLNFRPEQSRNKQDLGSTLSSITDIGGSIDIPLAVRFNAAF
jgi:outer membrane protein W